MVACAESPHDLAGAIRPFRHTVLRNYPPVPLDHAVDDRVVRRPVDGGYGTPVCSGARAATSQLPIWPEKKIPPGCRVLGLVQMGTSDELDQPVQFVDRKTVEMRVFRGDAAEMTPHAARAAPHFGRRKLR